MYIGRHHQADGSLVRLLRASGKHDEEVQFYAFDMLSGDAEDLRKLPLSMRKTNLARLLGAASGRHLSRVVRTGRDRTGPVPEGMRVKRKRAPAKGEAGGCGYGTFSQNR